MSESGVAPVSAPIGMDVTAPEQSGLAATDSVRDHIRGSSLLLGGRFLSLAMNLAVQILTVRYLAKHDFGAFAYAVAVASMGSSVVLCGLDKTISRFVPLYQERDEPRKALGSVLLIVATVAGLGLSVVLLIHALSGLLLGTAIKDPLAHSLLLVLIALTPLGAFDALLQQLMAVFASPGAIFLRRYVLGPGLKLVAVLMVVALAGNVHHLAYGYVAGSLLGVAVYIWALWRILHRPMASGMFGSGPLELPVREIFSHSMPLIPTELLVVLKSSVVLILLEYLQNPTVVAEYRAIYPLAQLNQVVIQNFAVLFIPLASRMFARDDNEGMNRLYWQTALWITVLSFPIFAVTFSLAEPLTVLLLGEKYADSAPLLAILSLAFYFHAATGFNALTLRVYGRVKYILAIDVVTVVASVGANLLLIPRFGALGAAISVAGMLIAHNLLNHLGLLIGGTGVQLLDRRYLRVYLVIALASSGLLFLQWLLAPPIPLSLAMALLASVLVIRLTRTIVRPEDTFPELLRVPLLRSLLR